jgi:hypothetical protein
LQFALQLLPHPALRIRPKRPSDSVGGFAGPRVSGVGAAAAAFAEARPEIRTLRWLTILRRRRWALGGSDSGNPRILGCWYVRGSGHPPASPDGRVRPHWVRRLRQMRVPDTRTPRSET